MMSMPVNAEKLSKTMNCKINELSTGILPLMIQWIDRCNGFIYGSVMMRYMMNIDNSIPNDIDIAFINRKDFNKFTKGSIKIMDVICEKFRSGKYDAQHYHGQPLKPYAFSEVIDCNSTEQRITLSVDGIDMVLHCVCMDSRYFPNPSDLHRTIDTFRNKFIQVPLLSTVYHSGMIHSTFTSTIRNYVCYSDYEEKVVKRYKRMGLDIEYSRKNKPVSPVILASPDMTQAQKLSAAKTKYQQLGFVVIPLMKTNDRPEGKTPGVANWPNLKKGYNFEVQPNTANIGIVCGAESGICCIDVDMKDDGMFYFSKMINKYHLPLCPTQETPNGGRHYIFKFDPVRMKDMSAAIKAFKVGGHKIGVDAWIQKCQFVAEPSINHALNKPYKWIVPLTTYDAIPDMPQWLYDAYNYQNISEDGTIIMNDESEVSTVIHSDIGTMHSDAWSVFIALLLMLLMIPCMLMFIILRLILRTIEYTEIGSNVKRIIVDVLSMVME